MNSSSSPLRIFLRGALQLMPLATGVVPFGLIMGTVAAQSHLGFFESLGLNLIIFAGASQLAAVELMNHGTPAFMVILTGLIINLRMIMYSTALAPLVTNLSPLKKIGLSYLLTDQAYAVTALNLEQLPQWRDRIYFYFGAGMTLFTIWQISVVLGLLFGDIAPKSLSLEFAVPLAFMSIVIPSIKSKIHSIVAMCSTLFSLVFYFLPFNMGLIVSALLAMTVGALIDREVPHG